MSGFSAAEALGAGFRVIRRTPWALLAWAVAYILLTLPELALIARALPAALAVGQHTQGAAPPDPARYAALQRQMLFLQPVGWITSILSQTLLLAAIFRAVLDPADRRWGYLRLGAAEFWLGLTMLVLGVLLVFGLIGVALPTGFAFGLLAASRPAGGSLGAAGLVPALLGAAGVVALAWATLRLSLGLPMSFARRHFLLFESWALTRGHALKLFAVAAAAVVAALLIELALLIPLVAVVVALGGSGLLTFEPSQAARSLPPIIAVLFPFAATVSVALLTIMAAPWADIYRQLTRPDAPA